MKRIALLTVLLLVVGLSLGFAQKFEPGIAFSGDATLSWGIDLDTSATGFHNTANSSLTLTLIPSADAMKGAEAPVYGWIKLAGIKFENATATAGTVTAGITAGPIGVSVFGAPSITLAKTTLVEVDDATTPADPVTETDVRATGAATYGGFGTTISYVMAPVTVKLILLSEATWTSNTANAYAVGADVALGLGTITITVGGGTGFNYTTANDPLVYLVVDGGFAPVKLTAAVDLQLATTMAYDASLVAGVTLMEGTSIGLGAYYGSDSNLDLSVSFSEAAAKGLVDNLALGLTVYVLDLLATMEYEAILTGSYVMGTITPSFGLTYGHDVETADDVLKATAAVSVAAFPNTTISATYTSGDLMQPALTIVTGNLGTFVVAVKVAY